jgi:hypothetical protein
VGGVVGGTGRADVTLRGGVAPRSLSIDGTDGVWCTAVSKHTHYMMAQCNCMAQPRPLAPHAHRCAHVDIDAVAFRPRGTTTVAATRACLPACYWVVVHATC